MENAWEKKVRVAGSDRQSEGSCLMECVEKMIITDKNEAGRVNGLTAKAEAQRVQVCRVGGWVCRGRK